MRLVVDLRYDPLGREPEVVWMRAGCGEV